MSIEVKRFERADETLPFEGKGHIEIVRLGGHEAARAVFEPGWRWSENVKPIAGTDSCAFPHLGYVLSGRMQVAMDDGTTGEIASGDVFYIPPGHDAHVVGDEPCVMLDFTEEDAGYAREPEAKAR